MTMPSMPPDDLEFWEEWVALNLQLVCLVERYRLNRRYTTADLRKMAKDAVRTRRQPASNCDSAAETLDNSAEV